MKYSCLNGLTVFLDTLNFVLMASVHDDTFGATDDMY